MPRIRDLRQQPEAYEECLRRKGAEGLVPAFRHGLDLYRRWSETVQEIEKGRADVNRLSREYGRTRDEALKVRSSEVSASIARREEEEHQLAAELRQVELRLPNWVASDVPDGAGDEAVRPIEYSGVPLVWEEQLEGFRRSHPGVEARATADEPFHHYALVGSLVDQSRAGEVAQSRFYYQLDELVILDLAISLYAVEFFRDRGYGNRLMITPYMLRRSVEEELSYLEAFEETVFEVERDSLILLPSSEHSILAYYRDTIFDSETLPLRILAWSPCFRREAGAHGKDTRGIFRVKQFHKVELHSIVPQGGEEEEVERMRRDVQGFLDSLELPNRSVVVPAGDMDKRAVKQIDVETWMPAEGAYRETHSIATLGTWVSEKAMIRYRVGKKQNRLAGNVYGTGVAVQRTICAIAENHYSRELQGIGIPRVLRKYTLGLEAIPLAGRSA